MSDLKTSFAGLELKNPVIVSSCGRTSIPANNKKLEEAGAGAIVLKSLFEENIVSQAAQINQGGVHTEELDYMQGYMRSAMLQEYVNLIKESKSLCSIPIIASINCFSNGEWKDFAKVIEEAGADALELNVMGIRTAVDYKDGEFEEKHVEILKAIKACVKIPVIMKLGSNVTNPASLVSKLKIAGADAVVLFNRFYQTNIAIEKMQYTTANVFTTPADLATPLRWTGIISAAVKNVDIAVSGGVHSGEDVVKAILAGASAVEVCSAIYSNGNEWIGKAKETVADWQSRHGYASVKEYCGKMNAADSKNEEKLERTQFLKYFEQYM